MDYWNSCQFKQKILVIGFFCFLIAIVFITMGPNYKKSSQEKQVCFKDNCFFVEIAGTFQERKKGLMFREYLEAKKGMLFVFEEEKEHSFWMKNTLIPLDIIWLNKEKEVVFIKRNIQPCKSGLCVRIKPDKKAKYVLELNAGTVEKIGLRVGEKLDFALD